MGQRTDREEPPPPHDSQVPTHTPPARGRARRAHVPDSSPGHDPRRRVLTIPPNPETSMTSAPTTLTARETVPATDGWPAPSPLVWLPFHAA